jgi:hypothetical protein
MKNSKFQHPISKRQNPDAADLKIGAWSFSGAWMLEFGA